MRAIESDVPSILSDIIKDHVAMAEGRARFEPSFELLWNVEEMLQQRCRSIPNLVNAGKFFNDVVIIGDTHGDVHSTARIVAPFLNGRVESLLFLGDYVDRGEHSLLNLLLVIALHLAWPERVIVLRGNHEDIELNGTYGFRYELQKHFKDVKGVTQAEDILDRIYDWLSLAAITPRGSICLHGGIPKGMASIREVNDIPKPLEKLNEYPDKAQRILHGFLIQLLWNDPSETLTSDFELSVRGPGTYFFNKNALVSFLNGSNSPRLVRAHESRRGGFQRLWDGRLLHVFSTEPYFGHVAKAHVIHETPDGHTFLLDLDHNVVRQID